MERKIKKGLQYFTPEYLEHTKKMSASEIAQFLDDYQKVFYSDEGKRKLISIRVPEKLLDLFKAKAKLKNQRYQTLIVELMRDWLFVQDE
ncbi:MAG: hypothetical protein CL678_05100 [Bdellovibrionaceae bacterium]|nr:hypothetical protein [Pseudobdellovibrionaceae bacterium]|tara:strand:+ start:4216 stop:4485 length:270 start_codon:yes stop_codon:yes gene_type:complete